MHKWPIIVRQFVLTVLRTERSESDRRRTIHDQVPQSPALLRCCPPRSLVKGTAPSGHCPKYGVTEIFHNIMTYRIAVSHRKHTYKHTHTHTHCDRAHTHSHTHHTRTHTQHTHLPLCHTHTLRHSHEHTHTTLTWTHTHTHMNTHTQHINMNTCTHSTLTWTHAHTTH